MIEVDHRSWICTAECRFDASTGSPAEPKLAALATWTGEPASFPRETAGENCEKVKFHSGIEFALVVTSAGGPCLPLIWYRLVFHYALFSCL